MSDVDIPQVTQAQTYGSDGGGWHFFQQPKRESYLEPPAGGVRHYGAVVPSAEEASLKAEVAREQTKMALEVSTSDPVFDPTGSTMPVFVLKSGTVLFVNGYAYQNRRLMFSLPRGGMRVMSADDIDWASTMRVNAQRGVRVTLRSDTSVPPGDVE